MVFGIIEEKCSGKSTLAVKEPVPLTHFHVFCIMGVTEVKNMDKITAKQCFMDYVKDYDSENPMIHHKILHTFRVADLAERIAGSVVSDKDSTDFAWFLGLLHDIGRFEQVRQYGTFIDSQSVDHAQFGANLLFKEGLIDRFPTDGLFEGWRDMAEKAIRLHNQLLLPEDLAPQMLLFARILRDADKVDIFRVVMEIPFEERIGKSRGLLTDAPEASPEVMACVMAHRCIPRSARRSILDGMISHCCLAFELEFEESRRLAAEQGDLLRLIEVGRETAGRLWGERAVQQMDIVRQEIEKDWQMPLKVG